jgi:hypothetical protein
MIALMASIKDKPDWERKVSDGHIVGKWKAEALAASNEMLAQDQTSDLATGAGEQTKQSGVKDPVSDYNAPARQRVVTENLFQWVSLNRVHVSYTS